MMLSVPIMSILAIVMANFEETRKKGSNMGCSERQKEIKRRRHRKKKLTHYKKRIEKASVSEKAEIANKLRELTPGANDIIQALSLEDR